MSTTHLPTKLLVQNYFWILLGLLVFVVFWSIVTEYEIVNVILSPSSIISSKAYSTADCGDNLFMISESELEYPHYLSTTNWSTRMGDQELLHLSALHAACVTHQEAVIPWQFGLHGNTLNMLINSSDPSILEKLRQCPDVDVFIPTGIRGFGYCEDAAAYTKFLQSRMLPIWVLKESFYDPTVGRKVTYHELCPQTPMIFFNHYWDGVPDAPDWPKDKLLYLMPNIEMYELVAEHYWRADMVLCKTAVCAKYVAEWYKQEGNPRNTHVFFTRHTTSNIALKTRTDLGERNFKPKDFTNVEFIHTAGGSIQKGTQVLLDCWLQEPTFPTLHLYISEGLYEGAFKKNFDKKIAASGNIQLHATKLSEHEFGKLIAEASFFVCPSVMEGYGHYINQARASKGLIITSDVPPMNELITPASGVLIPSTTTRHKQQFLGGTSSSDHALRGVPGFVASVKSKDICKSVEYVLNGLTPIEREQRANLALEQYYYDTVFFAQKMQKLRDFTRARLQQQKQRLW